MTNRIRSFALAFGLLAALNLVPPAAIARTISVAVPVGLARLCPNGSSVRSAQEAAAEAVAVNDSSRYILAREAARQYYRCAHTTDSPFVHDWGAYEYASWYLQSFESGPEFLANAQNLHAYVDNIVTSTKFEDVRKAARSLLMSIENHMKKVKAQLAR